ncbi:MAG: GtrA family protein [Bacteroidales bacterium]
MMKALISYIHTLLSKKLIRFFLVAGLNTVFGYLVFAFFIWCGLHYTLATLLGQVIGVLFNFKTYGALVFKNKKNKLLPRFISVYIFTYFCNIGAMTLLINLTGWSDYAVAAVMVLPIGLLGFLLNQYFVFRKKPTLPFSEEDPNPKIQ